MAEIAKLWSMGILFLISCVSGLLLPYLVIKILSSRCHSMSRLKTVLSALNCFSGGVFISTSLLILLPEGQEMTDKAMELLNHDIDFPVTELLAGFGFLLILLIESIVTTCHERHSLNHATRKIQLHANGVTQETELNASYQNGDVTIYTVGDVTNSKLTTEEDSVNETSHSHNVYGEGMSAVQSIALLIALSIHMLFDGLSLGLIDSDQQVWTLLLSLTIHKCLIFFSMGLHIYESTTLCKFVAGMLYISIVSPVGTGIGIALSSGKNSVAVTTTSAVLQSVAAGTFIYVAMFEILLKELSTSDLKLQKSIFVIFGYVFFAVIKWLI